MLDAISSASAFADFTQDMFLKLFLTQLKNQNPMEPMDNSEFTSQLAQMGQLEQLTELSSNFEKFLKAQELGYGSSLIGREVTYMTEDSDEPKVGVVEGVRLVDGEVKLVIGEDEVPLSAITEIRPKDETLA